MNKKYFRFNFIIIILNVYSSQLLAAQYQKENHIVFNQEAKEFSKTDHQTYTTNTEIQQNISYIEEKLKLILKKHPELEIGEQAVRNFYESNSINFIDPYHSSRMFLSVSNAILSPVYEVLKCLSIYHPEEKLFGEAQIGLFSVRTATLALEHHLYEKSCKKAEGTLDRLCSQLSLEKFPKISILNSRISESIDSMISIAKEVVKNANVETTTKENLQYIKRLKEIIKQNENREKLKKSFVWGALGSGTLTLATWLSVCFSGQTSSSSTYLTLFSTFIGNFIDKFFESAEEKPIYQDFVTASEICYLSSKLDKIHTNSGSTDSVSIEYI